MIITRYKLCFACKTCKTLAFVLDALCEYLQIGAVNYDILILRLLCHFLAMSVLPYSNSKMKRNRHY